MREWLEQTVPGLLEATGTPGLSLAVSHAGEDVVAAFGSLRPDSVVPAGSMAKTYVAVAILQLVERGELGLDDPVGMLANPLGDREVTIRDLLSFRSGLATDTTSAQVGGRPPRLARHIADELARATLREYHVGLPRWTARVGERFQYSNLGFAVLGRVIEQRTGRRLADHVAETVIEPLGLESTAFAPDGAWDRLPDRIRTRICPGHARFGRRVMPSPPIRSADHPANGLFTTAPDHLRFLRALAEGAVVAPETVELMRMPHAPLGDARIAADGSWHVGLGLMLGGQGRFSHFGHPGSHMWGWWHVARVYPELELRVVATSDAWDMLRWQDPTNEEPASLLVDALAARIADGAPPTTLPWHWRCSYVAGLILAERTLGFLGANGPLAAPVGGDWDRAAMQLAIDDIRACPPGPDVLRSLDAAGRLHIARHEIELVACALGARRGLPLPLWFW